MLNTLMRKARTLAADPGHAIRSKLKPHQVRQARAELDRAGLLPLLSGRPADALAPIYFDLWNLYDTVKQRRPKVVLEYGVGLSTVILARALKDAGGGKLITIDASERWLAEVEREFPDELRPFSERLHSGLRMTDWHGEQCHRYDILPDVAPDLVYLDGPDPADVPGWPKGEPVCACDPLMMEERFTPGFRMIVDGRDTNSRFLERHFRRRWKVAHNRVHKLWTFDLAG